MMIPFSHVRMTYDICYAAMQQVKKQCASCTSTKDDIALEDKVTTTTKDYFQEVKNQIKAYGPILPTPGFLGKKVTVLDPQVWEKCLGNELDTENLPLLDAAAVDKIKKVFDLKTTGDAGITLLFIPKEFSLEKMESFVKKASNSNYTYTETKPGKRQSTSQIVLERMESSEIYQQPYWVVVTNAPLADSWSLSSKKQGQLLSQHGCKLPCVPIMQALYVLTLIECKKKLYCFEGKEKTKNYYTRCQEQVQLENDHVPSKEENTSLVHKKEPKLSAIFGTSAYIRSLKNGGSPQVGAAAMVELSLETSDKSEIDHTE